MDAGEREQIEALLQRTRRRLYKLQLQAATFGISTPPEIDIQIEDTQKEIADLEAKLRDAPTTGSPTPPDTSAPPKTQPEADKQQSDRQERPEPAQVTLRFEPTRSGAKITWEGDALGHITSKFALPYSAQALPLVIKALDAAQYPNHPSGGPQFGEQERQLLASLGLWNGTRVPPTVHQLVGRKLYDALTRDPQGKRALKQARESARHQRQPLSYLLRFPPEAVELAALPWEALWDERQAVLLSGGGGELDSCERYLDLDEALSPPLPAGRQLRILALSPQAGISERVRSEEKAAREKSWAALKARGLIEWDELSPLTTRSLNDRMRGGPRPDIIHYYGHGVYKDGQGYLLFDSADAPGQHRLVDAARLAAQLGGIRLIVVHACESAMIDDAQSEGGLLTGIGPALSAVSEAVVAMQLTVRIKAATRFSEVFYEEIARGRSLQAAVAEGRRALYLDEDDAASWYVPTLYIRTRQQRPVYFVR